MGGWPQAQRVMMIVSVSGARVVKARNALVFCGVLASFGDWSRLVNSFIIDTSFFVCYTHTAQALIHT